MRERARITGTERSDVTKTVALTFRVKENKSRRDRDKTR